MRKSLGVASRRTTGSAPALFGMVEDTQIQRRSISTATSTRHEQSEQPDRIIDIAAETIQQVCLVSFVVIQYIHRFQVLFAA